MPNSTRRTPATDMFVQHHQRTSSQQFYNKFATLQCHIPTSWHVKMLGCGNFFSVGGEFVVQQVVELLWARPLVVSVDGVVQHVGIAGVRVVEFGTYWNNKMTKNARKLSTTLKSEILKVSVWSGPDSPEDAEHEKDGYKNFRETYLYLFNTIRHFRLEITAEITMRKWSGHVGRRRLRLR